MADSPPINPPPDPLVPAGIGGWFGKVTGVIRRSFFALAFIQIGIFVINTIIIIVLGRFVAQLTRGVGTWSGVVTAAVAVLTLLAAMILFLLTAAAQVASFFIAVLTAAGEPTAVNAALKFATGRVLPLAGWWIVAGVLMIVGFVLLLIPAIYLTIVFTASLTGVVVVERKRIDRSFELVNRRFWPTASRMILTFLMIIIYLGIVFAIEQAAGPSSITTTILQLIAPILPGVFLVAVSVVTYAELRFHESPTVLTPTLAAEIRR